MACRFVEGQLVRRSDRECPIREVSNGTRRATGTVWVISHVDRSPWFALTGVGKDCWPVRVHGVSFLYGHFVCSCVFDPVGEETPAKVRELEEAR